MADSTIRINQADMAKIAEVTRRLEKAERSTASVLSAARVEAVARNVASKVDAALNRALRELERRQSEAGASTEDLRALRRRLETLEGATTGAAQVSPLLALIPHPAARLGALAVAVGLGALEGSTREARRQRAMRAAELEDDRGAALDEHLAAAQDALERLKAARRRSGRGVR